MKDRIKQILKEKLNFNEIDISDDARIKEELGLDSLDFLTLIISIEKEFNIKIDDNEVNKENFFSLNTLEKFIKQKEANENITKTD